MSVFKSEFKCEATKNFCRMCFSETSAFFNVFETFIEENTTLAAIFMWYLRQDMYPDDDLPEFICCDCIEEVIDTEYEYINEEWKRTLRHLVWRTRILTQMESSEEKESLLMKKYKLPIKNLISEDEKVLDRNVSEKLGQISFDLLNYGKEIKGYPCKMCLKQFWSQNKLELHMKSCQYSYSHHCNVCGGVFFNSKDLNEHKNVFHTVSKYFPCGKCLKRFKSGKKLAKHIKRYNFQCRSEVGNSIENNVENSCFTTFVHFSSNSKAIESEVVDGVNNVEPSLKTRIKKEVNYTCCECVGFSASKNEVIAHLMEFHHSALPICCRICRTGFISRVDLGVHQEVHSKPFSCIICKRKFLTKRYYNKHIKFCQEKSVVNKCKICGMELSTRGNLRLHMTSHSLLRRYKCELCPKSYKLNRILLKHVRSFHLKLKPYGCGICQKFFSSRGGMKKHLITHIEDRPHECSICAKAFKRKQTLIDHERRIHNIIKPLRKKIIIYT